MRSNLIPFPEAPATVTVLKTPLTETAPSPIEAEPDWDTPLSADNEDANNAAYGLDAESQIEDAFERALDRIKRGDSLKVIVADAFRAGVFHGYGARLHDERISREISNLFQLQTRGGSDPA